MRHTFSLLPTFVNIRQTLNISNKFVDSKETCVDHSDRPVQGVGRGLLDTGIVHLNPTHGMDVCPRLSVLCCPVQAEALQHADSVQGFLPNVEKRGFESSITEAA
jgi:hypothetical protein